MILRESLSVDQFLSLIKQEIGQPKLKLLYRGSRDGFGTDDFHNKCDNHFKTITIIETTKGFIFGGYTQATWSSSSGKYTNDPNAFLFSLVNRFNKPFLSKVINVNTAIYSFSSCGPTFGSGHDICICDNSNTSEQSSSNFPHSYSQPKDINDPNGNYLCDSRNFQVKEIEVFQLQ